MRTLAPIAALLLLAGCATTTAEPTAEAKDRAECKEWGRRFARIRAV